MYILQCQKIDGSWIDEVSNIKSLREARRIRKVAIYDYQCESKYWRILKVTKKVIK
jgi:hypothetical protein